MLVAVKVNPKGEWQRVGQGLPSEERLDEPVWEREAGEGWGPWVEIYLMLEAVVNPLSHTKFQCFASRLSALSSAKASLAADTARRQTGRRGCSGGSTAWIHLPPAGTGALLLLDFIFLCDMQKLKHKKQKWAMKAKHDEPIFWDQFAARWAKQLGSAPLCSCLPSHRWLLFWVF